MAHPSKDQSVLIFTSPSLAALYTYALTALPTGPKSQGGFGGGVGASCFHPGTWVIGLQGIKVNKGSKDQVFSLLPLTPNYHPL